MDRKCNVLKSVVNMLLQFCFGFEQLCVYFMLTIQRMHNASKGVVRSIVTKWCFEFKMRFFKKAIKNCCKTNFWVLKTHFQAPNTPNQTHPQIDIRKMTFNIYLNIDDVTSFNPVTCFKENARITTFITNFAITYSRDKS